MTRQELRRSATYEPCLRAVVDFEPGSAHQR